MNITRRQMLGSAAAALAFAPVAARAAQARAPALVFAAAERQIRAFAEAVLAENGFPGMSIALVAPGWSSALAVGYADLDSRTPATPDHLFQIGSITKSLTAMALFALAGRGRLDLDARVQDLLPEVPLPPEPISLRNLLEHSSGLPNSLEPTPFLDVPGGRLWTGFAPGSRYSYCNLGYTLLGHVIERAAGLSFPQALQSLVLTPIGMDSAKPVIRTADRARYATGHSRLRDDIPWFPKAALTEARWLEMQSAAGSVGATAPDMVRYLQAVAALGRGRGGRLFSDALAERFRTPTIASDHAPGARYGNGLATLALDGRPALRHTGGMIGFSSAMTVDPEMGIGAYASVNVGGAGGYRPIEVSEFALALLRAAEIGSPSPPARQPQRARPIAQPGRFAGRWFGPDGRMLEIAERPAGLVVLSGGVERPLGPAGAAAVATDHPELAPYVLAVEPGDAPLLRIGEVLFARDSAPAARAADPRLAALSGRYSNSGGWGPPLLVSVVGDRLYLGTERLAEAADGSWRSADPANSPERVWFQDAIAGRPQILNFSGSRFARLSG
jgi:CubicO group peptidase (beta-lactamase class C family)